MLQILFHAFLLAAAAAFPTMQTVIHTGNSNVPPDADVFQEEEEHEIELDPAQETPVIIYDLAGGFRMPDPVGFEREPALAIYTDGRVVAGRTSAESGRGEWQIDEAHVKSLLEFAINEQDFLSLSSDSINAALDAVPNRLRIADAPSNTFTLNLGGNVHTVIVNALSHEASQHPDIEELGRLVAIENRLKKIRTRAWLGADEDAAELVNQVNDEFERQYSGVGEFTLEDILYAYRRADGVLQCSFSATFESEDGKSRKFSAGFEASEGGAPVISFHEIPAR